MGLPTVPCGSQVAPVSEKPVGVGIDVPTADWMAMIAAWMVVVSAESAVKIVLKLVSTKVDAMIFEKDVRPAG